MCRQRIYHLCKYVWNGKKVQTYCWHSKAILEWLGELKADLEPVTTRCQAMPTMPNLLASQHYLASESFQLLQSYPKPGRYIHGPLVGTPSV